MFQNLHVFKLAHAMSVHAGQRQSVTAQNMANADTPGYQRRMLTPFEETLAGPEVLRARTTRAGHMALRQDAGGARVHIDHEAEASPNGNSVSLEAEMLTAADIKRQHDRALTIYKTSLGLLRSSLGR